MQLVAVISNDSLNSAVDDARILLCRLQPDVLRGGGRELSTTSNMAAVQPDAVPLLPHIRIGHSRSKRTPPGL